jgi:hypothetical protein
LKTGDIKDAICIKHGGDFVPATETEREDAGTNEVVEEMCLPGARRTLYLHNISTMEGRQRTVSGMR